MSMGDRLAGVVVETEDGVSVPVLKGREAESDAVVQAVVRLASEVLEIDQGRVLVERDGVRLQVRELGVPPQPVEALPEEPVRVVIPKSWKDDLQGGTENEARQYDSRGIAMWRTELSDLAYQCFPEGRDGLPYNQCRVLCFPGINGREVVEIWMKHGFKESDFVLVERDRDRARNLRRLFPQACVVEFDFKNDSCLRGIRRALSGGRVKPDRLAVVSIDPDDTLTKKFYGKIRTLLAGNDLLAARCLVSVKFSSGGRNEQFRFYRELVGDEKYANRDSLRAAVMRGFIEGILRGKIDTQRVRINEDLSRTFPYEGDSPGTQMLCAMRVLDVYND